MIGFLRGIILQKQAPLLLLDVQGTGYEIEAPMTTFYNLPAINNEVELYIHMIVRDDAHLLFGFATDNERHLFRTLIKVNGVGAKMALTILSGIEADQFALCVQNNDAARLTKLPGVGKKTAERLIIEMRDRLQSIQNSATSERHSASPIKASPVDEAVSALISLGYKPQEASRFVMAIEGKEDQTSEALIREALKQAVHK